MRANRGRPAAEEGDRSSSRFERHERWIVGATAVGAVLGGWEWVGRSGLVDALFLSTPTAIVATAVEMAGTGELSEHLAASGTEFFAGYLLAVLTAVPLGLLAGWYARLNYALDPFLSALYATPRVALLPLIILWAGVGLWSKILVVFLGAFFPICMSTLAGVRTVDPSHLRVARSFLAGDAHVFRTVILPASVPFLVAGLRLGVGRALVGVVVGELYAASAGVGFMIALAASTFRTDRLFVGIAIIGAFGVLCNEVLSRLERRVELWRPRVGASV